jgi:hypothetical protein
MPKITIKPKKTNTVTMTDNPKVDSIATTLETKSVDTVLTTSKPVDVIPSSGINDVSPNEVELPRHLFTGFAEVLREQMVIVATQIAEKYIPNTPVEDIIKECVPDAPKVKTKKKPKDKKVDTPKITDFKEAKTLEDLKVFKIPELKDICSAHSLPLTGAKKLLMVRVWGISHPDDAPKEVKKKRGRKPGSGKKAPVSVEVDDSTDDQEDAEFELDPDNMATVFVSSDGKVVEEGTTNAKSYKLKMKFLFLEKEDSFDFAGVLEEDNVTFMEDPPEELLKLLGAE